MKKKTIAVDLDDVLAANAEAFVAYSNERWGTNLHVDDFTEHWGELWQIEHDEVIRRAEEYHTSGAVKKYRHFPEAKPVLKKLAENYRLILVTSRRRLIKKDTRDWIDRYFPGLFDDLIFAGFYDDTTNTNPYGQTKADIISFHSADFLIDDQPKHCIASARAGIPALLFGDYAWNRDINELPNGVTRVSDWAAVQDYFNAIT